MDNAKDAAQVHPLLPPASCILLVTSRQHFTLPGMHIKLGVLSSEDTRALLLRICERIGSVADEIARLCGYLPLALRAAGSLLAVNDDLPPTVYATQLGNERTRLESIGTEGVDIDVEGSFNLSYMHLDEATARVFRMLAVFPESFDAMAEETVCQDADHVHLRNLARYSFGRMEPDH